jgi:DNA-binding Lrp family transcriptional regulator
MDDEGLLIPAGILPETALQPSAKLVLARLMALARAGGLVFRSRRAIAGDLGLSTRAVERALRALEAAGRIALEVSHGGRGRPRGYRVMGAAPRLANLRTGPAADEGPLPPGRPVQLSLFEEKDVDIPETWARRYDPGTAAR